MPGIPKFIIAGRPVRPLRQLPGQLEPLIPTLKPVVFRARRVRLQTALDKKDNGCFIRNIHHHVNRLACFIKVRRKHVVYRRAVERHLVGLGLKFSGFRLKNLSNICFMNLALLTEWEKFNFFAITVPLDTGRELLRILEQDLAERQHIMDTEGLLVQRKFMTLPESLQRPLLKLVPLHPHEFLPRGLPLLRANLDADGQVDAVKSYIACNDGLLRETSDPSDFNAPEFPVWRHQTSRSGEEALNVWLIMMNAAWKFIQFRKNYGHEGVLHPLHPYLDQTTEILNKIYTHPVPSQLYYERELKEGRGIANIAKAARRRGRASPVSHPTSKGLNLPLIRVVGKWKSKARFPYGITRLN